MSRTNRSAKNPAEGQKAFGYTNPADLHSVATNSTGKNAVLYRRNDGWGGAAKPAVKIVATQGESYRLANAVAHRIAATLEELAFEYDTKAGIYFDSDKVGNPVVYFEGFDDAGQGHIETAFTLIGKAVEANGFTFGE